MVQNFDFNSSIVNRIAMKTLVGIFLCLLQLTQSQNITFTLSNRDFLPWIAKEGHGAIYNDMVEIIGKKLQINISYKREPWELLRKSVSDYRSFHL